MAEKKERKKKVKKASKFVVEKAPKHDGILYAHVESNNVVFLKDKASEQGVSLSTFMNAMVNDLKAGKAVSL